MRFSPVGLLLVLALAGGCTADRNASAPPNGPVHTGADSRPDLAGREADALGEWFTDRAQQTGLDFVHFNGMSGKFYQPEIMAPGVALFEIGRASCRERVLVQV